jgi:hypothetical protein
MFAELFQLFMRSVLSGVTVTLFAGVPIVGIAGLSGTQILPPGKTLTSFGQDHGVLPLNAPQFTRAITNFQQQNAPNVTLAVFGHRVDITIPPIKKQTPIH